MKDKTMEPYQDQEPVNMRELARKLRYLVKSKDESGSFTRQGSNSEGVQSREYFPTDPLQRAAAVLQMEESMPDSMRKSRSLIEDMEAGLAKKQKRVADNEFMAQDFSSAARGLDRMFGSDLSGILGKGTSEFQLKEKLPTLEALVAKERSKQTVAEQNYLQQIMSNFDNSSKKRSRTDSDTVRKGQTVAGNKLIGPKPLTTYQTNRQEKVTADAAAEFASKYLSQDIRSPLKTMADLYKKYEGRKAPTYRTKIGQKVDSMWNMVTDFTEETSGVGGRTAAEREFDLDGEMMSAAYDVIAQFAAKAVDSRITDKDVVLAAQNFNRSWEVGSEKAKRKALNTFINKLEEKRMTFYDLLLPREQEYLNKNNKGNQTFWTDVGNVPENIKINKGPKEEDYNLDQFGDPAEGTGAESMEGLK